MAIDITSYFSIAEAVSLLLFPHAEIVIHNLNTGKIVTMF